MSTQQTLTIDQLRASLKKPRKKKHGNERLHALHIPADVHFDRQGTVITAVLPWPPSDNALLRYTAKLFRGKLRVFDYPSINKKQYIKIVAQIARDHPCEPLKGDVDVEVFLFRPRRDSDVYRGKLLCDVLQGVAYVNDKQIRDLTLRRRDDKTNPRVKVVVTAVEAQGLFGEAI